MLLLKWRNHWLPPTFKVFKYLLKHAVSSRPTNFPLEKFPNNKENIRLDEPDTVRILILGWKS